MAVWILTQMKRWGYLKEDVNYQQLAQQIFLITDAKKHMQALGMPVPDGVTRKFTIMGKEFDPSQPEAYLNSFAIRKAS